MASFRPFVLGIDEDQALPPRKLNFGALYRARQPVLIVFRRPVQTDPTEPPASRAGVLGRKHRSECIVCTIIASEIQLRDFWAIKHLTLVTIDAIEKIAQVLANQVVGGGEFYASIKAKLFVFPIAVCERAIYLQFRNSDTLAIITPDLRAPPRIWKMLGPINDQQGRPFKPDVPGIAKIGDQTLRRFNSEVQQRCIDDMVEHRGWGKGRGQGRKSPAAMRA